MGAKRVCIVTNYSTTTNYGAILQSYALNRVIAEMGYETRDLYISNGNSSRKARLLKQIKKFDFTSVVRKIHGLLAGYRVKDQLAIRKKAFDKFRLSIPHTECYKVDALDSLEAGYDVFISGSDQIFRPNKYTGELTDYFWLGMIKGQKVKASYAASVGIEQYDSKVIDKVKDYLSSFDFISIREKSSADYIGKLTGRKDIVVSIDPVYLISREKWTKFEKEYPIDEPYILVYMIHGTEALLKSISEYAKNHNLKIVTFPSMAYVMRPYEKKFGDFRIYDADPQQFLYLLDHAECVFTDSFHGTSFSFILHKRVLVSRANEIAFSRIQNIVDLFDLGKLVIPADGCGVEHYEQDFQLDWKHIDDVISKECKKSVEYLKTVIESKRG